MPPPTDLRPSTGLKARALGMDRFAHQQGNQLDRPESALSDHGAQPTSPATLIEGALHCAHSAATPRSATRAAACATRPSDFAFSANART